MGYYSDPNPHFDSHRKGLHWLETAGNASAEVTKLTLWLHMASSTRVVGDCGSSLDGSDVANIALISDFHLSWIYRGPNSLILLSKLGYPILSLAQSIMRHQADGSLSKGPAKDQCMRGKYQCNRRDTYLMCSAFPHSRLSALPASP